MDSIEPDRRSKRRSDDWKLEGPVLKKAKRNVKEVAEIVLVLAAMGKVRGGKGPTAAEQDMMVEARVRLAQLCLKFSPKDVFPRDAFGGVIEDLGLRKLKEQRLGFRPPKMSIAEKLMLTKVKMEKTQEFSLPSASYSSQRSQTAVGTTTESRNASHVKMFPQPSHAANSSGSLQPASSLGKGTPVSSSSLPYQLPTSEVRPLVTSGVVSGNLVRDSSSVAPPRVGRPHLLTDGRPAGSAHILQVQAITTPTWPVQPVLVSAAKFGADTKVPPHATIKVEGCADVRSTMAPQLTTSRPTITQSTPGNSPHTDPHLQGTSFIKAPLQSNTHSEIGKIVQKFLQPLLLKQLAWMAPSRDYVNKALTCQMCESTIDEVANVLICDACEKGYHLKCLQTTNQKIVRKGEWHCGKCLSLTSGKPLPPKYGRVMRNINASKMPTIAAAVQSSPNTKVFGPDEKVSQSKIMGNGNVVQNSTTSGIANNHNHLSSGRKMENNKRMGGTDNVSGKGNVESEVSSSTCSNLTSEICSNNLSVSSSDNCLSPACTLVDGSFEDKADGHARPANSVEIPTQQFSGSQSVVSDAKEPTETPIASVGDAECVSSTSELFHSVDWIGNVLQVVDEKHYYQSCCSNGFIYNVQEYAIIRFEDGRLIPSKLVAMWEDIKAGKKWVTVKRCYFPRNLPKAVGRPCCLESNEVYLSNCSSTLMAGQIQGPCEVLPPSKFNEEREDILPGNKA